MASYSGHGSDARYECEASCGFRGTFAAVQTHEKVCVTLAAAGGAGQAVAAPAGQDEILGLAENAPASPTSPEANALKAAAVGGTDGAAAEQPKKKKGISFGGLLPPMPEPAPASRGNRVMQGWLVKQGHIRRNWWVGSLRD